jgi:hypothetical protein
MKLKLSLTITFVFFLFISEALASNNWNCANNSCYSGGPQGSRIAATGLSHTKTIQTFDISTLNLKNEKFVEKSVQATNSAISMTQSDFNTISTVGNSWLSFIADENKSFSMNIGTANNSSPQTWTLPPNLMNNFTGAARTDFVLPSSLPMDLQIAGANKVMKSYYLDEDDNDLLVYDHFDMGAATIEHIGTSFDLEFGTDQDFDEPNYEFADVPFDLGDNWTTIEDEEDYISGLNLNRTIQSVNVNGYGTISTPDGTFNCLRISYVTQLYSRPNESSSFTLNSTTNNIGFVTKEGYYFYGDVTALSGTTIVTNFVYRKITPTSSLTELSDVKLNNDSKGVTINTNNDEADPSSIFDVSSNNKGILIPRIAMANRPVNPATGLLIYQIDNTDGFYFYDGTDWRMLTADMPSSMTSNVRTKDSEIRNNSSIRGKNQLKNGSVFIKFNEIKENFEDLNINLTPEGDCNGLYISRKTREGFEVKELQKGKSNVKFSWKID